jgi:hypothetical protein
VVLAVNQKRVHTLVIEDDFQRAGWRCENCDAVGMTEGANKCPYCQGHLAWVEAFSEELVDRVLRDDGEVQIVGHSNKLHSYRGVAAVLRQNHGTGLAGHQYQGSFPGEEPAQGA